MTKAGRRRRWWRWALGGTALFAAALGAARATLPTLTEDWLVSTLRDELAIDLGVDDIAIDLAAGHVVVSGIRADVSGKPLARASSADVDLDVLALLGGEGGTVSITLHDLEGEIRREPDGRLNVARIAAAAAAGDDFEPAPESATTDDASAVPSARIVLGFEAAGAVIRYEDAISDPARPLALTGIDVNVRVARLPVSGAPRADELLDVLMSGTIEQPEEPAIFAAALWEGPDGGGRYLEAHMAVTAFDVRGIPQYVTPNAIRVLGGHILHASATVLARHDAIEQGLVEVDVEGTSTSLPLRFGGTLDDPRFDVDSPLFEVFRLSYLRVVDSGSSLLSSGRSVGLSLWRRTSGMVTETAGGIGGAASELSLRRLGAGLWRGISGLFAGQEANDEERLARWRIYAARQTAFRELVLRRRLEVAREREPHRVADFEAWFATKPWEDAPR